MIPELSQCKLHFLLRNNPINRYVLKVFKHKTFRLAWFRPLLLRQYLQQAPVSPRDRWNSVAMDPLSIAASAITVAALAASTCQAFVELRTLCKSLPGRLHALSNEVTDINVVLIQVASVFNERACSIADNQQQTILHLLEQAEAKLGKLQKIVQELANTCDRAKLSVLQAHAWRKEQPKLRVLQEDIKTVKCSLNIALGASNSCVPLTFSHSRHYGRHQRQAINSRGRFSIS